MSWRIGCIHDIKSPQNQGACAEWMLVGRQISLSNQRALSQRKTNFTASKRYIPEKEEEYEYSDRRSKSGRILSLETESCQICGLHVFVYPPSR